MNARVPWWVWALGVTGIAYLVYKTLTPVKSAVSSLASTIANIWLSLPIVGLPPAMKVLGNVSMPDGSLVPLSSLQSGQIRNWTDSSGNVNVLASVAGNIYQLAPSDANGNYPATLIGSAPAGA